MTMSNEKQADLQKLQVIEQTLHSYTAQKNSYQQQLAEVENAITELSGTHESYRIIGNIMVKASPEKLKTELDEKKSVLQTRITSVERQEAKLKEEMEKLQKQVLGSHE